LTLDGVEYPWLDGEELLFDQTYLHSAANRTETVRVILFCDVEKTQLPVVIKRLADAINYGMVAKFTGANNRSARHAQPKKLPRSNALSKGGTFSHRLLPVCHCRSVIWPMTSSMNVRH
jgi:aspartyl/asparaginyl beta-hydroxylase (cupin superfamily)